MLELSELEKDAITEAFNMGMGQAGNSLSKMVNHEVELSAPLVEFTTKQRAATLICKGKGDSITGVCEKFTGPIYGDAMLLFPEDQSLALVQLVLGDEVPKELLSEMEQEALTEVGNIILTGCLSSLADIIRKEVESDIPSLVKGTVNEILDVDHESEDEIIIVLNMNFTIKNKEIEGYVTFIMGIHSIERFRDELREHFQLEVSA